METAQSWGRYPRVPQSVHEVAWSDDAARTCQSLAAEYGSTLPFGNGRSYGDSCLAASGHMIRTRALDRLIGLNWETGVVCAESGLTLDRLLALAIPHGWTLPVTPGTRFVTLGGIVANDVHGKNHHVRGTIGRHVCRFGLLRSDGTLHVCAPDAHPALFSATIGGLGLTGLITWVEIQLMPVRSSLVDVTRIRFGNLDEFFSLSERHDPLHEYSVAWVDCQRRGPALGRGILMLGDHASEGPLSVPQRTNLRAPRAWPVPLFNRITMPLANELYYRRQGSNTVREHTPYDTFFYPLDRLSDWNVLYGRAGFQQYQCVVPPGCARDAIRAMLQAITASGTGSFLAVLKRCGALLSPGLLSFPMEGTSLALDFPQVDALNIRLFATLDTIVHEAGGRLYPAKDAHMSGDHFRAAYPQWQKLEALRDPALLSHFWQRTALN